MRIALFGSGSPMSTRALESLAARFTVAAVVVPAAPAGLGLRAWRRRWARWRARRPLAQRARRLGIPVVAFRPAAAAALGERLGGLELDLACVATFPHLLPTPVLGASRLGAIGLHPSLLPRHRGPDPLFWSYYAGDAETGVSVMWLDTGEDTGDVVMQERIPIERGRAGHELYLQMADRGALLLARAVEEVEAGTASRTPQDEAQATREPQPSASACSVDLEQWDAERLWHFLCGVGPARSFITAPDGRRLGGRAVSWSTVPEQPAGTRQRLSSRWRLHCRDGWVDVAGS